MFCCESESTLFGLPKEDPTRNQWLSCVYNTVPEQFNPNIRVCALCSAFYGGLFPELGRVAYNSKPTLQGQSDASDSQPVSTFLQLTTQMQALSSVE